ncbi:MAG TPA: selenocysteine-specific translation elongation factor [Gemmatimonadales bacterium]|nr:selenocysteine-specific translation elongation factor [Gemmatimonadales bacterium]
MIVGTAGHIDHGKSALVEALTGHAMDRLAEERRRGITIDLNFAPLDLGGGTLVGVVDVPGHEDFVRTMVAGASGVDLALLVVAADEGIMPQTLEHLAILEQLGVPRGIPVVTKSDLVDHEWLDLVAAELSELLASSRVVFTPVFAVSARTGEGVDALRGCIAERARSWVPRSPGDLFRLPVDRAFSLAGVGTVVTGTSWSGRLRIGDEVALLPAGSTARVRSIQVHGQAVERSEPGRRTAVGLVGIAREEVSRGAVLVAAGDAWTPTTALDVALELNASASKPVVQRTRLRVLHGTSEILARALPRAPIAPGGRGLARLALEGPLVARGGDRFVVRSYSPVLTIGGGVVLDPAPPLRRPRWPAELQAGEEARRVVGLVERRPAGVLTRLLPVLLGLTPSEAQAAANAAPELRAVGELWVTSELLAQVGSRCLDLLRQYHREQPLDRGMPLETLRRSLGAPEPVVESVLEQLARTGRMRRLEGRAALAGFTPRAAGGEGAVTEIVALLEDAGLTPPTVAELERRTGRRDVEALLRLAASTGKVEAVERDRYYARVVLDRFVATLRASSTVETIVPSELRQRLGISRKYLIPLLEWADSRGFTEWDGDVRRVRVPRHA